MNDLRSHLRGTDIGAPTECYDCGSKNLDKDYECKNCPEEGGICPRCDLFLKPGEQCKLCLTRDRLEESYSKLKINLQRQEAFPLPSTGYTIVALREEIDELEAILYDYGFMSDCTECEEYGIECRIHGAPDPADDPKPAKAWRNDLQLHDPSNPLCVCDTCQDEMEGC